MQPEIAIITCYYNARDHDTYFQKLYESIKTQNASWEWIIQCNRPMPDRQKMLLEGDDRVKVINNKSNFGPAIARNRALTDSKAPYVFAVDDDDYLEDGSLEKLLIALKANPNCFGAFGSCVRIQGDPPKASAFKSWPDDNRIVEPGEILESFHKGEFPIHAGTILWQRKYLDALGGWFALHGSEDTALVLKASSVWPAVAIKDVVYLYRIFSSSITHTDDFKEETPKRHQFIKDHIETFHYFFVEKEKPE